MLKCEWCDKEFETADEAIMLESMQSNVLVCHHCVIELVQDAVLILEVSGEQQ